MMSGSSGFLRQGNVVRGLVAALLLCAPSLGSAQDRYWDGTRFTRLQPGMNISVRTNEAIDTSTTDYRVFNGTVAEDVLGDDRRLAIPRGSNVELIVRRNRNNELVLDLESVVANGQRYAINSDPNRVVGTSGSGFDTAIGSIIGAIAGVHGSNVRIPRNTLLNFRLDSPLDIGVADRGATRDGYHYHDYYGRGRDNYDNRDRR
jgi:hypothetical protein